MAGSDAPRIHAPRISGLRNDGRAVWRNPRGEPTAILSPPIHQSSRVQTRWTGAKILLCIRFSSAHLAAAACFAPRRPSAAPITRAELCSPERHKQRSNFQASSTGSEVHAPLPPRSSVFHIDSTWTLCSEALHQVDPIASSWTHPPKRQGLPSTIPPTFPYSKAHKPAPRSSVATRLSLSGHQHHISPPFEEYLDTITSDASRTRTSSADS